MEKILFDSHSHISDESYSEDYESFIKDLLDSPLRFCMDIGTSLKTSRDCVNSARDIDFCYATVGVHPSEVEELTDESLSACLDLFETESKVVAIGEIGLDYHYEDGPDRETQIKWFARQVDWAIKHKAPICIHAREADEDVFNVLKDHGAFSKERIAAFPKKPDGRPDARVLLHCFSGSAELARQYCMLGAYISLGGPVTFKNARKSVEVAESINLLDLLIETDSPYMAPTPLRGTRNVPWNVELVARKIAELRGVSYEELANLTCKNACRFYGIDY